MNSSRKLFALASFLVVVGCGPGEQNNGSSTTENNVGSTNNATNTVTNGGADAGMDAGATEPDAGTSDMATTDVAETNGSDSGPDASIPVNPLESLGDVTLVEEGFEFLEGPHWFDDEGVLRFTDIPANTIYEFAPGTEVSSWRSPSNNANGLAADAQGRLLAAEHGARRISITREGQAETLVDRYMGDRFNSPNDLVVHSGGWLYFTDPPYGLNNRQREIDFNGLFRYHPDDDLLVAAWEGAVDTRPNGVVLSPDESILYLADTAASKVYAFDVSAGGSLSGEREFVDVDGPDGMAIDADGNLFVTSADGVDVFAPDGSKWGTIAVPRRPANCTFGGPDGDLLFITARQGLYRVSMVADER